MTEIKSGADLTASTKLLQQMRQAAKDGVVDNKEIADLTKTASEDAGGLTDNEKDLINSLRAAGGDVSALAPEEQAQVGQLGTSKTGADVVSKNIESIKNLGSYEAEANAVDFSKLNLVTENSNLLSKASFGLFGGTVQLSHVVRISDSGVPQVNNPTTPTSMQDRHQVERQNMSTMLGPLEQELKSNSPELRERVAQMLSSQRQRTITAESPEVTAKIDSLLEQVNSIQTDSGAEVYNVSEDVKGLLNAYSKNPPSAGSKLNTDYMSALRGAMYNASDTQRLANNELENIQNGNFQTPASTEQINTQLSESNTAAKTQVSNLVSNGKQLISQLEELQKKDPAAYKELMKSSSTEDLDTLKENIHSLEMHLKTDAPLSQTQMSQVNMVWGSLEQIEANLSASAQQTSTAPSPQLLAEKGQLEAEIQMDQGLVDSPDAPADIKAEAQARITTNSTRLTEINQQLSASSTPAAPSAYSESTQKLMASIRETQTTAFSSLSNNYFTIESAVSKQSNMITELSHAESTLKEILANSTTLSASSRTQLRDQLTAVQQAQVCLEQGKPVQFSEEKYGKAFQKVLDGLQSQKTEYDKANPPESIPETESVDASCAVDKSSETCVVGPTTPAEETVVSPIVSTSSLLGPIGPVSTAGDSILTTGLLSNPTTLNAGAEYPTLLSLNAGTQYPNPLSLNATNALLMSSGTFDYTLPPNLAGLGNSSVYSPTSSLLGLNPGLNMSYANTFSLNDPYAFTFGFDTPLSLSPLNLTNPVPQTPQSTPPQGPKSLSSVFLENVGGTAEPVQAGEPAVTPVVTNQAITPEQQKILATMQEIRANTTNPDLKIRIDDALSSMNDPTQTSKYTPEDRQAFADTLKAYDYVKEQKGIQQAQHFVDLTFAGLESGQSDIQAVGEASRRLVSSPEAMAQLDESYRVRATEAPAPISHTAQAADTRAIDALDTQKNRINGNSTLTELAIENGMETNGKVWDFIMTTTDPSVIAAFEAFQASPVPPDATANSRNNNQGAAADRRAVGGILAARRAKDESITSIGTAKDALVQQRRDAAAQGADSRILARLDSEISQLDTLGKSVSTQGFVLPSQGQMLNRASGVRQVSTYLLSLAENNADNPEYTQAIEEFASTTGQNFSIDDLTAFVQRVNSDVQANKIHSSTGSGFASGRPDTVGAHSTPPDLNIPDPLVVSSADNAVAMLTTAKNVADDATLGTALRDPGSALVRFATEGVNMPGLATILEDPENALTISLAAPAARANLSPDLRQHIEAVWGQTSHARETNTFSPDSIRAAFTDTSERGTASLNGDRSVETSASSMLTYVNSLRGPERSQAVSQAQQVESGIRGTYQQLASQMAATTRTLERANQQQSTQRNEASTERAREIAEQQSATNAKSAAAVAEADRLASELVLAPAPAVDGEKHMGKLISDFLDIIRDLDIKTRQLVMARLAEQMMNNAITSFYKDKMDKNNKYHNDSLERLSENFKQQVEKALSSSSATQVQSSQAVAAVSGQVQGSELSSVINQTGVREQMTKMLEVTSQMNPPLLPAQQSQILTGINRILEAAGTPDLGDDRLALAQVSSSLARNQFNN
jgi:hypothetical protein